MLDFVKKAYRNGLEASLWMNLILCAIGGAVVGGHVGEGAGMILGLIVGALVGIAINISYGGFIATFIAICENTENTNKYLRTITENMEKLSCSSANSSNKIMSKAVVPAAIETDTNLVLESFGDEITSFDAILKTVGAEKMKVVNVMQGLLGISLMEAKNIASYAPKLLKGACSRDEVRSIKNVIENAGGTVIIKAAGSSEI